MRYIPKDKEQALELKEDLSKDPTYQSVDNFIAIYNNNLVNVKSSVVNEVATRIADTYKNVFLINYKFIIKSEEEMVAEKFAIIFPHIQFATQIKRIATDILKDGYPEDVLMVFTESTPNIVHVDENGSLSEYEGAERLKRANESIASNIFLLNAVQMYDYGDDGVAFKAADVLKVDTSIMSELQDLLERHIKVG